MTCNGYPLPNLLLTLPTALSPQDIRKEADELECQFSEMTDHTADIIRRKEISVTVFKRCLIRLPVRNREQHREFLESVWPQVSDATLDDVWFKLEMYWDFLNYTLLEHLVNKFGDEGLRLKMEGYKNNLKEFRCQTRLCDFAEQFKDVNKCLMEIDTQKFVVKLAKNWEECTLEDLENWRKNITQKLLLPSFALILREINTGSVSVTWAIPAVFAGPLTENMETMDLRDLFEVNGIISMSIDGPEVQTLIWAASSELTKDLRLRLEKLPVAQQEKATTVNAETGQLKMKVVCL